MCRYADQEIRAEGPPHNLGSERIRRKVDTVRTCGAGNVGAIVYQQRRNTTAGYFYCPLSQFKQGARRELFFPELDQVDAGGYRGAN
jgi:hypothetical protein